MNPFSASQFAVAALALVIVIGDTAIAAAPPLDSATEPLTPAERLKRNRVEPAPGLGDAQFRTEQEKGLKGDKDAALKVAQMFKTGTNGVPRDEGRMTQWLLHASSLGNGAASYELYQYYVDQRLDREAIFFESRAIEQGYVLPPRLDPRR